MKTKGVLLIGILLISFCFTPLVTQGVTNEVETVELVTLDLNENLQNAFSLYEEVLVYLYIDVGVVAQEYNITVSVFHESEPISEILFDGYFNFTGSNVFEYTSEYGDYMRFNDTSEYGIYIIEVELDDGSNNYLYDFYQFEVIHGVGWINGRFCNEEDAGFGDDETIFYRNETVWIDGNAGIYKSAVDNATILVTFNKGGSYGISPVEIINETVSFINGGSVCFLTFNGGLGTPLSLDFPPNIYPVVFEIFKDGEMQSQILIYYIKIVDHDYGGVETTLNTYNSENQKASSFEIGDISKFNGTIKFTEDRTNISVLVELFYLNNTNVEKINEIINTTYNFSALNTIFISDDILNETILYTLNNSGNYFIKTTLSKDGTIIQEEYEYFEVNNGDNTISTISILFEFLIIILVFIALINIIKKYFVEEGKK